MRKLLVTFLIAASVLPALAIAAPVRAAVPGSTSGLLLNQLQTAGETGAGYSAKGRTDPYSFITKIIQAVMSILGVVFLALTVYGGYVWMLARGNEQDIERAKKIITAGVVGLAIILSGYIISVNVLSALLRASGQTPAPLGPY
jgi:hypothetical protein